MVVGGNSLIRFIGHSQVTDLVIFINSSCRINSRDDVKIHNSKKQGNLRKVKKSLHSIDLLVLVG